MCQYCMVKKEKKETEIVERLKKKTEFWRIYSIYKDEETCEKYV